MEIKFNNPKHGFQFPGTFELSAMQKQGWQKQGVVFIPSFNSALSLFLKSTLAPLSLGRWYLLQGSPKGRTDSKWMQKE